MGKHWVVFRAGGRLVRFAANKCRARNAHVKYTPYQPPGKRNVTRIIQPSQRRKQVYRCLSCGKRYVDYKAAIRHRNTHKELWSGLILE